MAARKMHPHVSLPHRSAEAKTYVLGHIFPLWPQFPFPAAAAATCSQNEHGMHHVENCSFCTAAEPGPCPSAGKGKPHH